MPIKYIIKRTHLGCLFILSALSSAGQTQLNTFSNSQSLQYAFSFKAAIEINYHSYKQPNPNIRISANGGLASYFLSNSIYPALNVECELYNGGLGSKNRFDEKKVFTLDFITAFTITSGIKNHFSLAKAYLLNNRYVPLYYFNGFLNPALQNPYTYSLSIGTNLILSSDKMKTSQRIGFINFHFDKVQVSYFNDGGTPINQSYLGDRKDRYYTGGAVVSYNGRKNTFLSDVKLSYNKFTGYTKNAFEASNKLSLSYMDYHKREQHFYNKSVWALSLGNVSNGWEIGMRSYNSVKCDVQHLIHFGLMNSYHMVPYAPYTSIFGSYNLMNSTIGIK